MTPVPPPEREVALYEALIATHPEVERKGKSSPYTSINGNMFTILSADGVLGMRLGAADREAFVEAFGTGLYEAHGAVMKEYVAVPAELLAETERLAPYLARATTTREASSPNPRHAGPEPARSRK
jgi:hypothetical protein